MQPKWSSEIAFEQPALVHIPTNSGVYQILQSCDYSRYRGSTRVLKIGMSRKNLRAEVNNHFQRHTCANRLIRIRAQDGVAVTVQFAETDVDTAKSVETQLLCDFEMAHWDLPLLNSTRGFARGTDSSFE